jgi:parallel beta-helix repeat protein
MGTVTLSPGGNIQEAINSNPAGTTFYLTGGTYDDAQFLAKGNDHFIGDPNGGTILDGGGYRPYVTYDNGSTGVLLQDLTVQNYAAPAQHGAIQTGQYWTLNNVTAQWNTGPGCSLGAHSTINGGYYINNGQTGINGYQADGATVSGAELAGNNWQNFDMDWEAGGLKFVSSADVILDSNYVHDNNGMGLWGDVDCSNWTVTNNTVLNNAGAGIQYEISHGARIDGNTVTGNGRSGVYISNSNGVEASGNTVTVGIGNDGSTYYYVGSGGIDVVNDWRGSGPLGPYLSVNDDIEWNTIIHQNDTAMDGIAAYQPLPSSSNDVYDNNTYYMSNPSATNWMFGITLYNWNSLHQQTSYEAGGTLML